MSVPQVNYDFPQYFQYNMYVLLTIWYCISKPITTITEIKQDKKKTYL